MKRALVGLVGLALATSVSAVPAHAQVVYVDVGVRTPHIGARVVYGPRPTAVARTVRYVDTRPAHEWVLAAMYRDAMRGRYRSQRAFQRDYRKAMRKYYKDRRRAERAYARHIREAERDYHRWLRDMERDRYRGDWDDWDDR